MLNLLILPAPLAICRLPAQTSHPDWAAGAFCSITRTADELSIVCEDAIVPANVQCNRGWRALQVQGPLDFNLTGILASFAAPLAAAGISIFAISTFDTDYVLVREHTLAKAVETLKSVGHRVKE